LTPDKALQRFSLYPTGGSDNAASKVDITSSTLSPLLERLASHHVNSSPIIVRISAPIHIRVLPTVAPSKQSTTTLSGTPLIQPSTQVRARALSASSASVDGPENVAMLEAFMSEWTSIVGDPILSKWIILALAVSLSLNGYLLKGIGASTTPIQQAVAFAANTAEEPAKSTSPKISSLKKRLVNGEANGNGYHDERMKEAKETNHISDLDFSARPTRSDTASSWASVNGLSSGISTPLNLGAQTPRSESPLTVLDVEKWSSSLQLDSMIPAPVRQESLPPTIHHLPPTPPNVIIAPQPISLPVVSPSEVIVDNSPLGTPGGSKPSIGRRSYEECLEIFEGEGVLALNDEEIILLSQHGKIAAYALEKILGDFTRAVKIRRALICTSSCL